MGDGMNGGDQSAAEVIWTSARGRYEAGREPVSAIARDLGLTPQALTARARADGWTLRSAVGRTKYNMRGTIGRFKSLLQQRLAELESQIGGIGEPASAVTGERDIRAINTLVRTLEKVLELERKERAQRSRQRKHHRQLDDAEREAFADKLAGLCRELRDGSAEPRPADPPGEGTES